MNISAFRANSKFRARSCSSRQNTFTKRQAYTKKNFGGSRKCQLFCKFPRLSQSA